jgi:hypothetical protein
MFASFSRSIATTSMWPLSQAIIVGVLSFYENKTAFPALCESNRAKKKIFTPIPLHPTPPTSSVASMLALFSRSIATTSE